MSRSFRRAAIALAASLLVGSPPLHAQSRCTAAAGAEQPPLLAAAPETAAARRQIGELVREANRASHAVGAARLLADAARADVDAALAAAQPQAALSGSLGAAHSAGDGGAQSRLGLNVSAPLWDGGRVRSQADWRRSLAEAARHGEIGLQEQVGLQTVSLVLERGRFVAQRRVFERWVGGMRCLVEALDEVVRLDRGRASELLQARKTLQQAELSRDQALSALRQTEVRLARLVGDRTAPETVALAWPLFDVPELPSVLAAAERSAEIAQLGAQADAAERLTRVVESGRRPQLHWNLNGSTANGAGASRALLAGVTLSMPLLDPVLDAELRATARRADAARQQLADALQARRQRAAEVHEQALAAQVRAQGLADVVRDSDRVRDFTLQQWQQLGRRSLFDVISADSEHHALRIAQVNALYDAQQAAALLLSIGPGLNSTLD